MTTTSGIWVPACAGTTAEREVLAVHLRLFLLAMLGHAGPVLIDLHVAPEVLRISGRQQVALVNGLSALLTDPFGDALRVAGRCQRDDGNSYGKGSQTFLKVHHDESPSKSSPRHAIHLGVGGRARFLGLATDSSHLRTLGCDAYGAISEAHSSIRARRIRSTSPPLSAKPNRPPRPATRL